MSSSRLLDSKISWRSCGNYFRVHKRQLIVLLKASNKLNRLPWERLKYNLNCYAHIHVNVVQSALVGLRALHLFSWQNIVSRWGSKQIIITVSHNGWKGIRLVFWHFAIVSSRLSTSFLNLSQDMIETSHTNECSSTNMLIFFFTYIYIKFSTASCR